MPACFVSSKIYNCEKTLEPALLSLMAKAELQYCGVTDEDRCQYFLVLTALKMATNGVVETSGFTNIGSRKVH